MIESLQDGTKAAVTTMDASQNQARHGVEKIAEAGGALGTIVNSIRHIHTINTQIARTAEEQSAVAHEINRDVAQINKIAEASTHNAEQTQEAGHELSTLSHRLQTLVSQFKS